MAIRMRMERRLSARRGGRWPMLFCTVVLGLCGGGRASGKVEVHVVHAGLPSMQGDLVRSGAWLPVIVDLDLLEGAAFDGSLRLAQFDIDGDECYDSVEVHLRSESGGAQRYYLYVVANPLRGREKMGVELRDAEGGVVQVVSQGELTRRPAAADAYHVADGDSIFLLSLSTGTAGRIEDLVGADQQDLYSRRLHVGHMSPADLPELWIGLEAVDYIVWEDAKPESITERQLGALIEWVRQGGTLLIMAARSAGGLRLAKPLDAILPASLGEVVAVTDLRDVRTQFLGVESGEPGGFPRQVEVCRCTMRPGAELLGRDDSAASDVITRRREGRGHVILAGIAGRDLFSGTGSAVEFFRKMFHLRRESKDANQQRAEPVSLFRRVVSAIAFTISGSIYLLVAAMFSIVYILTATFGVWGFLGSRGWRHHSWSAFAAVALLAGFLSILAVNSVQGFGDRLHQVSIVDVDANQAYGHASAYFGLKTGSDKSLDVWLPSDPFSALEPGPTSCFLRALPMGNDPLEAGSSFADPEEYRLIPGSAVIEDVRIRATLKRFEGRWAGRLGGKLTGEIGLRQHPGGDKMLPHWRITDDSYLVNELNVDLTNCYLLHTSRDIEGFDQIRSDEIYAYPIGKLPSGGGRVKLGPLCHPAIDDKANYEYMGEHTLDSAQQSWSGPFRTALGKIDYGSGSDVGFSLGDEHSALLLLSTVGEFNPTFGAGTAAHLMGIKTWSRDRLRQLDMREQLRTDSVILLGFAADPGPVRLFRRQGDRSYGLIDPDPEHSWTMYRVRIPIGAGGKEHTRPRPGGDA